jgi:hypothetical protein
MVLGTVSTMLLLPEETPVRIPLYLYYLLFLILGHYFAARSGPVTGAAHAPLHLPRGTFRFLIVVGFTAVLAWGFYNDPKFLQRLTPNPAEQPYLLPIIVGAFFAGIVVARIGGRLLAGPQGPPAWSQDILAWIALLAMLGMGIEIIVRLVVNPTVPPERQVELREFESAVAALVAFYFGARS